MRSFFLVLFLGCAVAASAQEQPVVRQPDRDIGIATLEGRQRVQCRVARLGPVASPVVGPVVRPIVRPIAG